MCFVNSKAMPQMSTILLGRCISPWEKDVSVKKEPTETPARPPSTYSDLFITSPIVSSPGTESYVYVDSKQSTPCSEASVSVHSLISTDQEDQAQLFTLSVHSILKCVTNSLKESNEKRIFLGRGIPSAI